MALLEVTGISKNFGSTHVLQNISLNLEKGEALADRKSTRLNSSHRN